MKPTAIFKRHSNPNSINKLYSNLDLTVKNIKRQPRRVEI